MFKDKKSTIEVGGNVGGNNRIVAETKIKGEILSKSDFRIDGEVEGDIQTVGRLVIGKSGFVKGKIVCENADIEGVVEGTVQVSNILSLKATAKVSGDVKVGKLSVEPGAEFNVSCSMGNKKQVQVNGETNRKKEANKTTK